MARATFNDIKDELARVASNSGMTASDPKLKARVKSIQTRLGYKGNWRGVNDMLKFYVYDRAVVLPMQYEAAVRFAVCDEPMPVMPGWYEFLEYGPGPQDDNSWVNLAINRGESPLVRQSTDLARKLRAYSYADERTDGVPNTVTVHGYDANDNWVRTESGGVWQDGVTLDLNGHDATNWAATSMTLTRVTRILKTATNGRVEFYWVDADDTTLYFGGKVNHYETNPMYSRFVVPSLGTELGNTYPVKCVARRKIQTIITGDEELIFDNVEAYRLGLIAMAREESDKPQNALYYWTQGYQCLLDEFVSINGDSNAHPKVNVVGEQGSVGGEVPEIM